jgi:hypothetical protein
MGSYLDNGMLWSLTLGLGAQVVITGLLLALFSRDGGSPRWMGGLSVAAVSALIPFIGVAICDYVRELRPLRPYVMASYPVLVSVFSQRWLQLKGVRLVLSVIAAILLGSAAGMFVISRT